MLGTEFQADLSEGGSESYGELFRSRDMSSLLHSVVQARLAVYLRVWAPEAEGRGAKRADMPQSSPKTEFHDLHISLCIKKHCDISKQLDTMHTNCSKSMLMRGTMSSS